MDLQTQLKYVKYTYLGLKFFQLELTIFALALFTYPVAMYKIEAKYKHNKEKLYYAHHGIAPPELKVYEIDRNLRYLDEQTINEPIETTPKLLIDKALNMGEDLISFISTERTADIIAFSQNGKGPEYKNPSEPTNQDFEDYYDNYIHLNLALSLISIFVQFFIICTLLFGEYVKYRIKMQTTVQPPIEMAVIEGADGNAH
ncbi:hypothetical protein Avbf_12241 [Armadillidium vulgare]|nr:hypothetical protein Avbf_12241 [Armadillidium vulgare]